MPDQCLTNLLVNIILLLHAEFCDYCLLPTQVHCTECGHGYCLKCSSQRHQHPARKSHNIISLISESSFEQEEEHVTASQQGMLISCSPFFPPSCYINQCVPKHVHGCCSLRRAGLVWGGGGMLVVLQGKSTFTFIFLFTEERNTQLLGLLVKNFGLTTFKNWQLEVIKTVIMPAFSAVYLSR